MTNSLLFLCLFRGAGGGEVSGGGTLYMKWGADNCHCHKRGLRGEKIFVKYEILQILRNDKNRKYDKKYNIFKDNKMLKNSKIPLKMEHFTLEFRVF
jgi:hypothetical protein